MQRETEGDSTGYRAEMFSVRRGEMQLALGNDIEGTSLDKRSERDALTTIFHIDSAFAKRLVSKAKKGEQVSAKAYLRPTPHEEFMRIMRGTTDDERCMLVELLARLRE